MDSPPAGCAVGELLVTLLPCRKALAGIRCRASVRPSVPSNDNISVMSKYAAVCALPHRLSSS
jgi:hypothetical protein